MRIGAHVSISGDPEDSADYASLVGCECVQVFAKSPRRWEAPAADPDAARAIRSAFLRRGVAPLYTHTAYLLNLAGPDDVLWAKSAQALGDEIVRASMLGAAGIVTHLGTFPDGDSSRAAERIAEAAERAYRFAAGLEAPPLLLENGAGAGTTFGATITELGAALTAVRDRGLPAGLCLDTCHAWAAGYDLSCPRGWRELLDESDAMCGRGAIALVHANDSVSALGERRDRHEWIGRGAIGELGFAAMFAEPRLAGAACVTELSGDKPEKDAVNLAVLSRLRGSSAAGGPHAGPRAGRS